MGQYKDELEIHENVLVGIEEAEYILRICSVYIEDIMRIYVTYLGCMYEDIYTLSH